MVQVSESEYERLKACEAERDDEERRRLMAEAALFVARRRGNRLADEVLHLRFRVEEWQARRDGLKQQLAERVDRHDRDGKALMRVSAERDWLRAEIGSPPPGSHPDEAKPRAATWHGERANWVAEVERLRAAFDAAEAARRAVTAEACHFI